MNILQQTANSSQIIPSIAASDLPVTYTRITTQDIVAKTYQLVNGSINKTPAAQTYRAKATKTKLPFKQFCESLNGADSYTAACYGVTSDNLPDELQIVTKASGKRDPENGVVTRTKLDFSYSVDVPAVVMFDHDFSSYGQSFTPSELIKTLSDIHPQFADAAKCSRGSISSGIHLTNEQPKSGNGFHIYAAAANGWDVPRYLKLMCDYLWLKGHGFIALSASGAMLERCPLDAAVGAAERYDFIGKPVILGEGIEYSQPETVYIDGTFLDTSSLPDLTAAQLEELNRLKINAKEVIKPLAKKKARVWAGAEVQKRVAKGVTEAKAKADVSKLLTGACVNLDNDFVLEFASLGVVSVAEVLADSGKFDGEPLADPVEGVGYGTTTAKFYWNDGKPVINSHAHGGVKYFLPVVEADWQTAYDQNAAEFNKSCALVVVGGKTMVMRRESDDVAEGIGHYSFVAPKQLSLVYANRKIQVAPKRSANIFDAWMHHPDSKSYTGGVIFMPGGRSVPDNYLNLWEGFAVEPLQNDALLERIFHHIYTVICDSNTVMFEYCLNWIAYTFQYPEKQIGSALVVRGLKGAGKSSIFTFLRKMWGRHGLHITNPQHLVGKFNAHLMYGCFIHADEAFFSKDLQHEGVLKALITEQNIMVECKGLDAFQRPNFAKVVMTTNADAAVPASRDERRYCVFDAANTYLGNREYFNALLADCDSKEVQAAFLYAMLNRDVSNWHSGNIPDSIGLRAQRYHSMNSVQKWLVDGLVNGAFHGRGDVWLETLGTSELFDCYNAYCDASKTSEHRRFALAPFSKYLSQLFTKNCHAGGRGKRGFVFGDLVMATLAFEAYEKVNLEELTS